MHIPAMNVPHKFLKKLTYSFDMYNNTLHIRYDTINITQENIAVALTLNVSSKNLFCSIFCKLNFDVLSNYFCVIEIFLLL
ncbi:hypothetical protein AHAS_Ahas06G0060900 [Arachis hypogaea]